MRRDFAQRAATLRFLQSFCVMWGGAAISTLLGGFFSLFIAFATGAAAGQTLSPAITRHNRPWVYLPAALVLFCGAWVGWSVAVLVRLLLLSAQRGITLNPLSVPIAALFNGQFWVFFCIAAIVASLRMR
ncbi:MAG: hypothetical protein ACR2NO_07360 [Chloroflexota bacterium]